MADVQKTSDRCSQRSEMETYLQNLSEGHACTNNNLLFTAATPLLNQKPGECLSGSSLCYLFVCLFLFSDGMLRVLVAI